MTQQSHQPRPGDVLVVGAGPTGLFLAYTLARQGASVRLIDRHAGPATESRAMGVQARTLEFYRMAGIADAAISLGVRTGNAHVWVEGRERAAFSLAAMGAGQSPYPFLLTLAQDVHERFLIDQLATLGIAPEWKTELVDLVQSEDEVKVTLQLPDGTQERTTVPWLVGCDGAHSIVRERLGIGFGGGTTEGLFFVADVQVAHPNTDLHIGIGAETLAIMMPVRTSGTQRLIGIVPPAALRQGAVTFNTVGPRAAELLSTEVTEVHWFSTYKVHHKVADHFRVGRCFIAGDAGHIHSPIGGQGMNTGLGDAMNLGWKLGHVITGQATPGILDTYEPERIAFARSLIASTDAVFGKIVATGWMARLVRLHLVPSLVRIFTRFAVTGRTLFEAVSQVRISYRDSGLNEGAAGRIGAGERLPWVDEQDLHAKLDGRSWTAHAIGPLDPATSSVLKDAGIDIAAWSDTPAMRKAGYRTGALYLVRPDGDVGFADVRPRAKDVSSYLARHGIRQVHQAPSVELRP